MSVHELLREKRAEMERIAASHGVHTVRVFGSVPGGEAQVDSDLDLLA